MTIEGWLVIDSQARKALFLDHSTALIYAQRTHGTLHPLVRGDLDSRREASMAAARSSGPATSALDQSERR